MSAVLPYSDGMFLCCPCFRNAEKLLQMRWEGCKLEDKLAELLKQLGEQQGLSLNVSGELKISKVVRPACRPASVRPSFALV